MKNWARIFSVSVFSACFRATAFSTWSACQIARPPLPQLCRRISTMLCAKCHYDLLSLQETSAKHTQPIFGDFGKTEPYHKEHQRGKYQPGKQVDDLAYRLEHDHKDQYCYEKI
jgi:hypothetical protein